MARRRSKQQWTPGRIALVILICAAGLALRYLEARMYEEPPSAAALGEVPAYSGSPYIEINGNVPDFTEEDLTLEPFEYYSELDGLERCGAAYANICQELMPTEKREDIGRIKPTNVDGMLPFENLVADYVKETGNHVLYRVTPVFEGAELVARGVQMEAMSVEDGGEGVYFNVYAYNVQPGIGIDYATGDNWPEEEWAA